jgi:hypothetical protein
MLQETWNEVEYRLDIYRATIKDHTEIYSESYILRKNSDTFQPDTLLFIVPNKVVLFYSRLFSHS